MGWLLVLLGFFLLWSSNPDLQFVGILLLLTGIFGDWSDPHPRRQGGG